MLTPGSRHFQAEGTHSTCLVVKGRAACHEPKDKMLGRALPKCFPKNTTSMALSPESSSSPQKNSCDVSTLLMEWEMPI